MNQDGRQPHILVVVDDHHLCDVLAEILTEAGYQVQCAHDGEAAWAAIQAHSPDLLLSDITMPRLDGVSLALRLVNAGSRVPMILMSAGPARGEDVIAAFVCKPLELDALLARIARVLEESNPAPIPR
jgi:two-component system, OmpR family, response regulator MprA